jgi:CHAD domain-containing protein
MASDVSSPVQVLREHTRALEAALSVCLADPGHKAVHRLRTETRRVEAQLVLLQQMAAIPEHRDEATALLKELKRLRRAAGEVRDLDVQRKMLEAYEEPQHAAADSNDVDLKTAPGKSGRKSAAKFRGKTATGSHNASVARGIPEAAQAVLQKGAGDLRSHMASQREASVADLEKLLKKRQAKLAGAAEELLKALHDGEKQELPVEALLHHAEGVLRRDALLGRTPVAEMDEDELHTVRKAAKAARYLAETMPGQPEAVVAGQRFETLQDSGGQWHDLLDLARAARRFLGKSHALTVVLAEQRDRKLDAYRAVLQTEAQAASQKRKKAKGRKRVPTEV